MFKRIVVASMLVLYIISVGAFATPPPDIEGQTNYGTEWTITGAEYRGNQTIILDGNLTIESGGSLMLYNVTLIMNNTNYDGQYNIEAKNGGMLNILNGSIITDSPYDVDDDSASDYEFMFWVRDGAGFTMKDSELHECGYDLPTGKYGLLIQSDLAVIDNSLISNNFGGIEIYQASPLIINSTISLNIRNGIYSSSASPKIINSTIILNGLHGIGSDLSSGTEIINCNISSNTGHGVVLGLSSNHTISSNNISDNDYGILLTSSSNNNISNNNVSNNNEGVRLESVSDYNTISGNNISLNNEGIVITAFSSNNTISGNSISSNVWFGTQLWSSSYNVIYGNNISNNWIGVYLYSSSSFNTIFDNNITLSQRAGIQFFSSSNNNILNCNVSSNTNDGVWIQSFSTNNTFINSTILGSSWYDFSLGQIGTCSAIAINTIFDKSNVYFDDTNSTLTVKWYMHVYVESTDGLPISDANVDVTNITSDSVDGSPFTTRDDGFVRWIVVTDYIQNDTNGGSPGGDNKVYHTPHNVTATLNGITGYAKPEPVMDSSKVITVILDMEKPIADAGTDASVNEDEPYTFDGSGSVDNIGITNWTWNFGDGSFGYGETPLQTYISSGFYVVVLNVTDAAGTWDTDTVNIFVNNVPPTADAGNDKMADEGEQIMFDGSNSIDTASDIDSMIHTWHFGDGTVGSGKIVNHSYEDNGTYTVTLQVTDNDGATSVDSIIVTVNNTAPKITSIPLQFLQEDQPYTLQVIATDVKGDTLTFLDNTTMFDIDPVTGVISFTPTNADVGMHLVNVTVTDDDGALSYIEIQMNVQNTNDAPIITSLPITVAVENSMYYYNLTVMDEDMDPLIYTLDVNPEGMNIDSNGVITWTPADQQASQTFMVIVNVSDGNDFDTQTFSITVMNVNDEPAITSTPISSTIEDVQYAYDVTSLDLDTGDRLIYSLDTAPIGMSIDSSTGLITWVPTNDQVGDNKVIVNVTDSMGAFAIQEFTVTVANINDAPIIDTIGPLVAIEGDVFYYSVGAVDIDTGDTLTFSDDTDLFDINSATGNITFTPSNDDIGIYVVKITVTDSGGLFDFEKVLFTVINVNNPPTLTTIGSQTLTEDVPFTLAVTATDIDIGDSLIYLDNTTLFDVNPSSGVISFTPTNENVGSYLVNITIKDKSGIMSFQTVTFTVNNVNDPPLIEQIGELTAVVGKVFNYNVMATDVDHGETLTFSDDTELFDVNPNTGEISFTPTEEDAGVHYLTITVTDGEGKTDQTTVAFTVLEPKDEEPPDYTWILLIVIVALVMFLIGYLLREKGGLKPVKEIEEAEPEEIMTSLEKESIEPEEKTAEEGVLKVEEEGTDFEEIDASEKDGTEEFEIEDINPAEKNISSEENSTKIEELGEE